MNYRSEYEGPLSFLHPRQDRLYSQSYLLKDYSSDKKVKKLDLHQKMVKLQDTKSQAVFNNRNNKVMTGMFSDTDRDLGTLTQRGVM